MVNQKVEASMHLPSSVPITISGNTYNHVFALYDTVYNTTTILYFNQYQSYAPLVVWMSGSTAMLSSQLAGTGYMYTYTGDTLTGESSNGEITNRAIAVGGYSASYPSFTGNYFLSTWDIVAHANEDLYGYSGFGSVSANQVLMQANSNQTTSNLTIIIDPPAGGSVTDGGSITCTSATCQYPMSQVSQSSLTVNNNGGYAFGGWIEKENPHPLTLNTSVDKTITAKFYKTFRNAVTDTEGFRKAVNSWGDQCIVYVRDETDIPYSACHGNAMDCFGLAQAAGYKTGTEPKEGAIAVFSRDDVASVGHVAIVKEIINGTSIKFRHSNWCDPATCETISEDIINVSTTPVMGYIYPTPQ